MTLKIHSHEKVIHQSTIKAEPGTRLIEGWLDDDGTLETIYFPVIGYSHRIVMSYSKASESKYEEFYPSHDEMVAQGWEYEGEYPETFPVVVEDGLLVTYIETERARGTDWGLFNPTWPASGQSVTTEIAKRLREYANNTKKSEVA